MNKYANIRLRHPLPWRVVDENASADPSMWSVADANGETVIGSSEWLTGGELLPWLVEIVNKSASD